MDRGYTSEFSRAFHAPGIFTGNISFGATAFVADRDAQSALVEVVRTGPTAEPCSVQFATINDTAVIGQDYVPVSGSLSFAAGESHQTFSVALSANSISGETKSVGLVLSSPQNAALGAVRRSTLFLLDPLGAPVVSIDDAQASPGADMLFTVRLSKPCDQSITVHYATVDGTAVREGSAAAAPLTPGYVAAEGRLTFVPGEIQQQLKVTTLPGLTWGSRFAVVLLDATHGRLGTRFASGTILNPPLLTLSDSSAKEGEPITFALALSIPAEASVDYVLTSGSATAGTDFAPQSGTVTFSAGKGIASITVSTLADNQAESDETFFVQLTNARGAIVNSGQAKGTILEQPALSVSDASGDLWKFLTFLISLSRPGPAVTVNYTTVPGTAAPDVDYVPQSGTLTIPAGETNAGVTIGLLPAPTLNPEKTFFLKLTAPRGATLARSQAQGTVNPAATLYLLDAVGYLPDRRLQFTIAAAKQTYYFGGDISVDYTVSAGTALPGRDFLPQSGTLNLGELFGSIDIPLLSMDPAVVGKTVVVTLAPFFPRRVRPRPSSARAGTPANPKHPIVAIQMAYATLAVVSGRISENELLTRGQCSGQISPFRP